MRERRLIDAALKAQQNAGYGDGTVSFDTAAGVYRLPDGQEIGRDRIGDLVDRRAGRGARAGGKTLARAAVWRALLREPSGQTGSRDGRPDGLLARIASLAADSPQAVSRLFSAAEGGGNSATASTVESVNAEVAGPFDQDISQVVTVVATSSQLPDQIRFGFERANAIAVTIDKKRVFIVADRIARGTARGTVIHELGVHMGLNADDIARFGRQVRRWALGSGPLAHIAKAAIRYGEQSASTNKHEEPVAYMIQFMVDAGMTPGSAPTPQARSMLAKLLELIRAAARALGLTLHEDILPSDMVNYVYGAAKMALRRQPDVAAEMQFSEATGFDQQVARARSATRRRRKCCANTLR